MDEPWHKIATQAELAAEAYEAWEYLTEQFVSREAVKCEFGPAGGPYTEQEPIYHTLAWMLKAMSDHAEYQQRRVRDLREANEQMGHELREVEELNDREQ